jgi:hypothetical protein
MKSIYVDKTTRSKLPNSQLQRGFSTGIALSFGLFICAIGIAFVSKGIYSKDLVTSQTAKVKSLSAAEIGITEYRSLLNENRQIAVYCANSTGQTPCDQSVTWSNITDTVLNPNGSQSINTCTGGTTSTSYSTSSSTLSPEATKIRTLSDSTQWQNVDPNNAKKGQYRLVRYQFVPNTGTSDELGTGIMVVEGRVNQNLENVVSSSTSRLVVKIPIKRATSTTSASASVPPGLWINYNPNSTASGGSSAINSVIQDSTCADVSDSDKVTILKQYQNPPYTTEAYDYNSTPGQAFPNLPSEGQTAPSTGVNTGVKIDNSTVGLPKTGDVQSNNVYTYHFTDTGKSVDLSGGGALNIGTVGGNETVILHLDGPMVLSGGSSINIRDGAHLIVYAHNKIDLSGGSTNGPIQNSRTPDYAQIYAYGSYSVKLSGGSGMKVFVFAPNSLVEQSGASIVNGTIWAKSWKASGGSILVQGQTSITNTKVGSLSSSSNNNLNLGDVQSWRECPLDVAIEDCL